VARFQVPTAQLLQPPKIQQSGGAELPSRATRSKVGRAALAFQTWSHSPLHSTSVISSNRSIERLGFIFIFVFLFYLHLCFSVYFAKLILFTTDTYGYLSKILQEKKK